jgi:hypothetical protein
MSIIENHQIRNNLFSAFPKALINGNLEFIAHPHRNSYFLLDGVETETEVKAKVIEWLSREAIKGGSRVSQKYHMDGINTFLGQNFTDDDMEQIYTYLGNAVNHQKTVRFIESGYDMSTLRKE